MMKPNLLMCLAFAAAYVACGSEPEVSDGNGSSVARDTGATGGRPDGNAPAPDAGEEPIADAGPADATRPVDSGAPDAGGEPDAGEAPRFPFPEAPATGCSDPFFDGRCGPPAGIQRAVVRLGDGMDRAEGRVEVRLNHLRLGQGAVGGVPHTGRGGAVYTFDAGMAAEVHFDMCGGGEMWSEENCGYNLFAWIDVDFDGQLDPGEPAGSTHVDVSCFADAAGCHTITMDCLDGISCVAFDLPATCTCRADCPDTGSQIVTCTP